MPLQKNKDPTICCVFLIASGVKGGEVSSGGALCGPQTMGVQGCGWCHDFLGAVCWCFLMTSGMHLSMLRSQNCS